MESVNYSAKGVVFDIQRYSIHDGPGIRTIIFLKGCPLRCKWCSNPESQEYKPDLLFRKGLCIGCGSCITACKAKAIDPKNKYWIDRTKCISCGECALVCPSGALSMKGKQMTVEEVIKEVKKDETQYYRSNGGVTLSGGEALTQPKFAKEIFKACKAKGWHTAIETEGFVNEDVIRDVVPYIDLVLLDIKSIDPNAHKKFTGVDNSIILKAARAIQEITHTIIRVPVIPGFNVNEDEIRRIAEFAGSLPNVKELHLLGYHNYGEGKYELLGREYELKGVSKLKDEELEKYKKIVESYGLECKIGG